jgi:hypothetical protein
VHLLRHAVYHCRDKTTHTIMISDVFAATPEVAVVRYNAYLAPATPKLLPELEIPVINATAI